MRFMHRLKSFFNRRRVAGLCVGAAAVLFAVLSMYSNYWVYYLCKTLCVMCILIALYLIFLSPSVRKVLLEILEEVLLRITRRILEIAEKIIDVITNAIRKIIKKIKDKFSFGTNGSYKGKRMAKGYVDIKEKVGANGRKGARKRKKKFKDMDNVEKVRFLYERKMVGAIKNGIRVEESMTPNEAGSMLVKYRHMKNEGMELIDKYNFARYDDEGVITDDMVERVKKL